MPDPKDVITEAQPSDGVAPEDQQDFMSSLDSAPIEEQPEPIEKEIVEEKVEEQLEEVVEEEKPEPESEEEPEVEEPEVEEETKEEPSEEKEEDEVTDEDPTQALTDANEALRDQIIAMAEQGYGVRSPEDIEETPPKEEETPEETEKPEPIKLEELKIEEFLTEDERDRVNDHPELLNTAFARAMAAFKEYVDATLQGNISPLQQEVRALPQQVSEAVGGQLEFNTFVNSFYDDNPDLTRASKFVYITYKDLLVEAQKKGEKTTIGDLYSKAGDEVRKVLSIPKTTDKPGKRKAALPGAKSKKIAQEEPSSETTQQQFMEMLKP